MKLDAAADLVLTGFHEVGVNDVRHGLPRDFQRAHDADAGADERREVPGQLGTGPLLVQRSHDGHTQLCHVKEVFALVRAAERPRRQDNGDDDRDNDKPVVDERVRESDNEHRDRRQCRIHLLEHRRVHRDDVSQHDDDDDEGDDRQDDRVNERLLHRRLELCRLLEVVRHMREGGIHLACLLARGDEVYEHRCEKVFVQPHGIGERITLFHGHARLMDCLLQELALRLVLQHLQRTDDADGRVDERDKLTAEYRHIPYFDARAERERDVLIEDTGLLHAENQVPLTPKGLGGGCQVRRRNIALFLRAGLVYDTILVIRHFRSLLLPAEHTAVRHTHALVARLRAVMRKTQADALRVGRKLQKVLLTDEASLVGFQEGVVHCDHTHLAVCLDDALDLERLVVTDEAADGGIAVHDLEHGNTAGFVALGDKPLGNNGLQHHGQLGADLVLLPLGERIHDTVDGGRGADRMQRGKNEVSGLGRGEGDGDRLQVTHLTDEDDVRILTQGRTQSAREGLGVEADLTLIHESLVVMIQILDRVLERQHVAAPRLVDPLNDGSQGRRLAGAGWTGDQDQAGLLRIQVDDGLRQSQGFRLRNRGTHDSQGSRVGTSLLVGIDTKAPDGRNTEREIDLTGCLEPAALLLVHDAEQEVFRILGL